MQRSNKVKHNYNESSLLFTQNKLTNPTFKHFQTDFA